MHTEVCSARDSSLKLKQYRVEGHEDMLGINEALDCISAFIVTGCTLFVVMMTQCGNVTNSCSLTFVQPVLGRQAGTMVQNMGIWLKLRRLADAKRVSKSDIDEAYSIVRNLNGVVWLERLFQNAELLVDQCVLVDANTGIILDFAEELSIQLCPESLRFCGDANSPKLVMVEVK